MQGYAPALLAVALAGCSAQLDLDTTAQRLEAELTMPDGYALTNFGRHYALMDGDEANAYLGIADLIPSDDRVLVGLYLYGEEPVRYVYGDWTSVPQADDGGCMVIVPIGSNGEFLTQPELGCRRMN
ncbi:MAG: hypothetical protein KDE15_14105 [Erythrobacter sp.]|nr:hypothetical protein [Erythrobacter sp.]